jgi:hypothetical protein
LIRAIASAHPNQWHPFRLHQPTINKILILAIITAFVRRASSQTTESADA